MTTYATRPVRPDAPGTALAKFLIAQVVSMGSFADAIETAEVEARSQPHVAKALREQMLTIKGAVTPTEAPALTAINREAFELLQSASIFGRLTTLARRVPFRSVTPRDLSQATGAAWRGEGLPRPVLLTAGDNMLQDYAEAAATVVLSRDLFRFNRTSEQLLIAGLTQGVSKFVDEQLLSPAVSGSAVRPASLTYGAAQVSSSGTSGANVLNDLESLIAAIESPGDGLVWIMRSKTYRRVVAKLASLGVYTPAGLLLGIPVLASSTSPAQITLVDAPSIALSYDDGISLETTMEATIEMNSVPTQDGSAGTGAGMVSLYQSNLVAIGVSIPATWQPAVYNSGSPSQPAGVAYMTVTY